MDRDEDPANAFRQRPQSSPLDSQPSTVTQASEGARSTALESERAEALEATVGSVDISWSSGNNAQDYIAIGEATHFTLPVVNGEEGFA